MNLQSTLDLQALATTKSVPLDDTITHFAYIESRWGVDPETGEVYEPRNPATEKERQKWRKIVHKENKRIVGGVVHALAQPGDGKEQVEMETRPEPPPSTGRTKRIKMIGTNYCVVADGQDKNFGCYPDKKQAQAVMDGKAFIEPNFPDSLYAGGPGSGRHKQAMKEYNRVYKLAKHLGYKHDDAHQVAIEYYLDKVKNTPKMEADGIEAAKVIRLSPPEFRRQERKAGIKPYVKSGGPGSGRKKSGNGLNKFNTWDKETRQAAKDPKQIKLPLKTNELEAMDHLGGAKVFKPTHIKLKVPKGVGHARPNPSMHKGKGVGHRLPNPSFEASMFDTMGEPLAGAQQQVHMDTNSVWFRPPSAKNSKPVPTDDPGEKNDKFLDVTKRNSKDTKQQRMKLLKRQGPGGLPPQVPARTTAIEPNMAYYNPSGLNASARVGRKRRLMVNEAGSFRAFGAALI